MTALETSPELKLERAEELVLQLTAALSARRIYASDHSRSKESTEAVLRVLSTQFEDMGSDGFVRLTVTNGVLLHDGVPLGGKNRRSEFADRLTNRDCGGVLLRPQVDAATLERFFEWMLGRGPEHATDMFDGLEVLELGAGEGDDLAEQRASILERVPDFRLPLRIHRAATELLDRLMEEVRNGNQIDFGEVKEVAGWAAEAAFLNGNRLLAPTQVLATDPFTFQHSVNVFLISTTLLQPFASSPEELARYAQAALLHDIGKSRVPREILYKKGTLTDDEFAVIRQHPEYGAEILARCRDAEPITIQVAFCHHMRDDGYGYPQASLPIKPGPIANAVQVADMFEALTADRPYQKSLSVAETVDILMGTPGMDSKRSSIGMLLDRLTNAPTGSEVILNTGEHAVVVGTRTDNPKSPIVQIITNEFGGPLAAPLRVDLAQENPGDSSSRYISKVILKPAARRKEASQREEEQEEDAS